MCEFCGCNTGRSSLRRARKGKPLDVRIVAVETAAQARPPARVTRPSLARSHSRDPDRTVA